MSAPARLTAPLPPLTIGASWSQPFALFGDTAEDPRTPEGIEIHLARRDRAALAAGELIVLTSAADGGVVIADNRFTAGLSPTATAAFREGIYEFQLFEQEGEQLWPRLVGVIAFERGPISLEAGDTPGSPLTGGAPGGTMVNLYGTETVRIVLGPGGAPGGPGDPGLSAYQVAVANGFVGDEAAWLASLVGPPGAQWGQVDGDLSAQTDLQVALDAKQAADGDLAAIAALTPTNDDLLQRKAGAWINRSPAQVKADLALARADVGLSAVDNTADADKPISTAAQSALDGKQAALGFTPENAANKGAANGYAPLGADSRIDSAYIPAVAITDTWEVASQGAMLALTAQRGDVAIRTDENKSYVLSSDNPSTLADWKHLRTPTDAVLSVAGKTGAVTLVKGDVGLSAVDNTADADKPISTAAQSALDAKLPASAAPSGDIVGDDDVQTLTNKRIAPRVSSAASAASPWAWSADAYDVLALTALANALTLNADAGAPVDGQKLIIRIKDDGTARALTWTTGASKAFRAVGVTLPTTTVSGKVTYVGCIFNAAADRWDVVAVGTEA